MGFGATYTVCSSGCNDTNLQDLVNDTNLAPADVVEVRAASPGGTITMQYSVTLESDDAGDSNDQLTIQCRSGDTCVIDGQDSRSEGFTSRNSAGYVTLDNFTIKNHTSYEIRVESATGFVIEDITIPDSNCTGVRYRYNTDSVMRRVSYDTVDSSGSQTDGLYIQDSVNTTIEYSYIEITNGGSGHNDCFQQGAGTSYAGGGTFRYNYCNQDNADTVNSQGMFWEDAKGTWYIYANFVDGNDYVKNLFNFKTMQSGTFYIYNNTVLGGTSAVENMFRFNVETGSPTINMYNNVAVFLNSSGNAFNLNGSATFNIDYNVLYCPNYSNCYDGGSYGSWQNNYDANGDNSNPNLTNGKPTASSSNLIGQGTDLGNGLYYGLDSESSWVSSVIPIDFDPTWDVGAFEYLSDSNPIQGMEID